MSRFVKIQLFALLLFLAWASFPAAFATNPGDSLNTSNPASVKPVSVVNPTAWISDCYNRLNGIYLYQAGLDFDTAKMFAGIRQHEKVIRILKKDFYDNKNTLSLRSVFNLKMRVAEILSDVRKWQQKIHTVNEALVVKTHEILLIKTEIELFRRESDSIFRANFDDAVNLLAQRQRNGETAIVHAMKKNTGIENSLMEIDLMVYLFYADINTLHKDKEQSLLSRELPPVWRSSPAVYPKGIGEVVVASFKQTLESLEYYGEMSLWRIIIFRALIFILCLIPIKIFNDELRKKKILDAIPLVFLDKFPKTASLIMGLALAPFVFVHPPHAFMEFILIGLTFTTTMLIFKLYPKINKVLMASLIAAFLILYLINFFVTPTFIGRLIYSSSILLLIPLYRLYKQLPEFGLRYYKEVRILLYFLAIHLVTGWFFEIWGNYTLGRSIILAAFSLLVIIMIVRVTICTLIDYLGIIAYFLNQRMKTVKINAVYLQQKIRPMLLLLSVLFIVTAYLFNMNVMELVDRAVTGFLTSPRQIGSTTFTVMSILLFFLSVILAFFLATLIRYTLETQQEHSVNQRSKFGGYLLLLRILVILSGFVIGIIASGLPINQFSIFLGALGIGVGLGLQTVVSNLVSGLIIAFERPFVIGDMLEFGAERGRVKEISLRATLIATTDDADILIPNSTLLSQNLKNWTNSGKQRFVSLDIVTDPEVETALVIEIIGRCLDNIDNIQREKSTVYFSQISESGCHFNVFMLIDDLSNGFMLKSLVLSRVQAEFLTHKIRFGQKFYTMPPPQAKA